MTSAGGHPRTRDELADQLRAAQRGAAAPWLEQARREPPPLLLGLMAATVTYLWLDIDPGNSWLIFPAVTAMPAFQAWVAWRSPAIPSGRMPRELRRPLWILLVTMPAMIVTVWALAQVLDPWPVVAIAGVLTWSVIAHHCRAQERALGRLQERLQAAPLTPVSPGEDEGEPALLILDPLLDSTERIGCMSLLTSSSRAVHVDLLREHLSLGDSELGALMAELEQARYVDHSTSRVRGDRFVATYPGTVATRRHRLALRRMLAGSPA